MCPQTVGYLFRFVSSHVLQRVQMTICSYARTRMRLLGPQVYDCCVLDNFRSMDDLRTSRPLKDSEAMIHSQAGGHCLRRPGTLQLCVRCDTSSLSRAVQRRPWQIKFVTCTG